MKYFKGITMMSARRQTSIKVDAVAWDSAKEIDSVLKDKIVEDSI